MSATLNNAGCRVSGVGAVLSTAMLGMHAGLCVVGCRGMGAVLSTAMLSMHAGLCVVLCCTVCGGVIDNEWQRIVTTHMCEWADLIGRFFNTSCPGVTYHKLT